MNCERISTIEEDGQILGGEMKLKLDDGQDLLVNVGTASYVKQLLGEESKIPDPEARVDDRWIVLEDVSTEESICAQLFKLPSTAFDQFLPQD